jgi:hypothetical protein
MTSWTIDCDYIEPSGRYCRAGRTFGARGVEMPHRWRVLDDDGEIYYAGRCSAPDSFAPLDWAQPYAGATDIQYLDPATGRWISL